MAEIKYRPIWSEDGKTLSNVLVKDRLETYNVVTEWYDGTPMDDSKIDDDLVYVKYQDKYLVRNFEYGQVLQKDSMHDMREASDFDVLLLNMGVYKCVQLNGYFSYGDTPSPIMYSVRLGVGIDNGVSIIRLRDDVFLYHNFDSATSVRYIGVRSGVSYGVENREALINSIGIESNADGLPDSIMFEKGESYYIEGFINFVRRNINIDLNGATIHFRKEGVSEDQDRAFIRSLGGFSLRNGSVSVEYERVGGLSGYTGALVYLGARFKRERDEIKISDFLIENISASLKSNAPLVAAMGDSDNLSIKNIDVDAGGIGNCLFQYEWGFYTDEASLIDRKTTHARNINIYNCTFVNGDISFTRPPIVIRGAYTSYLKGLTFNNCYGCIDVSPGEAAYYNTKEGDGLKGMSEISFVDANYVYGSVILIGSHVGPGAYTYDSGQLSDSDKVDLHSHDIKSVVASGMGITEYGIAGSSNKLNVTDCVFKNMIRGLFLNAQFNRLNLSSTKFYNMSSEDIYMYDSSPVIPNRFRSGYIARCVFEGMSGRDKATIRLTHIDTFGISENMMTGSHYNAVLLSSTCWGVIATENTVEVSDSVSYMQPSAYRRNRLSRNYGVTSSSGGWGIGSGTPRGASSSKPLSGDIGDVYLDSTLGNRYQIWDGGKWRDIVDSADKVRRGTVLMAEKSNNTASVGPVYNQAEIESIISELRDLKSKMIASGMLEE